ncbi:unnamed protein product [Acanthocheilonema viteae]|uniref:Mesocentin n=1 Tax=Acanthocheilonema viteae TaxID=6277 RepID=A0A498SB34_ACAVI|nr:unnamed protein product [Acanthocheilonema viteae]
MALGQMVWPIFPWVMLALLFAPPFTLGQTLNERGNFIPNLVGDLRMEEIMRQINRFKRATKNFPNYQQSSVVLAMNDTGRCVVSADKASHYCGDIEVTAPPFPPPDAGQCHFSTESGREICWPRYEDLDTTCTDVGSGMVSAPAIKHAAIRAMAFVPPDNLRRLVRQYYRQKNLPIPQNTTFSKNSFLFALYECDDGYEFVDEVNSMFCINRQWVITPPKCRGKGLCEVDNGGCSHSCLSIEDREVECRCPHGLVLDSDQKTCIKPIPKNLCRILNSCSCTAINENQYSCTCPTGEKCLLLRGRPKIYIEPAAPYEITPGGNLNITCSAVSYPFPQIFWQRGDETVDVAPVKPGTVRSEQILIIKELYKNTQFTCHANNSLGKTDRTIEIVVTGPGSAPIVRGIDAGRSSVYIRWDPPVIMNRPVTSYTVYYTSNGNQPIKNWKKVNVDEPNREVTIKDLRPNTQYFIRLRANDKLGPGRLSNPVSLNTRKPAIRPQIFIQEGDKIYVGPLQRFRINCNVTRGDPSPKIAWYTRARPINKPQRKKFITMEHGGLYESTNFSCVAENEAGRTTKRIQVIVTGPTSPERIRYQINGNNVDLQWEPPRITNGPLKDYDVLYTDNPNLSDEYWEVEKAGSADARSLRISNLKEKKDYTFKMRAYNELGPGLFSDQFTLTTWLAARPPVVTITPAEKIVKDPSNEELVFECEAVGVPRPKILWLWSGGLVEDGKNEFRIYDVTPPDAQEIRSNSKLIAEKTNRAGVATCQAVNAYGSDEKRTEVKIVGPGSPPRDIVIIPFTNNFKVTWNPPKYPNGKITRYIIYYTKNPDDALGNWEKTSVEGDQLEVTIPADEDTPYNVRVQAATKDGLGLISEAYDVTTGKKPVPLSVKLIILDPEVKETDTETVVEPLQTIKFKCDSKGRPAPQISYSWLPFNETESGQEPIPIPAYSDPEEVHRYHSLDVNTNTVTKRALMCTARNADGSVSDRHIFNVLKPGSPPENIQAIIDPDNRVTISWQEPKYPNGPIIKYKVYVTSDPAEPISDWRIYDAEPSEAPHLVMERGQLQPETPYYVRVAAVGEEGDGLQSDIVLFETVSGAPIDAPKDVLATVEQDNTMDISWTGPSVPNGQIQAIYFTPLDEQQTSDDAYKQWDKIIIQSNDNSGTLRLNKEAHDILPNQLYRIRISATNDLSEGPASEPITVRTESGETSPVIRLEPSDNPATVPPHGSVSVRCIAIGIPPPTVMWIIGTNASDIIRGSILQLSDLRKDETATCKAENNAGQVQEVLQILVAGPGTPPNEIVTFPLENQEANIEWTTPDSPNGKITDYIIHYGEVFNGEALPRTWETIRVSADEPQKYRLAGLKPKTNYAIRLQAISDRGPGVLSDPIRLTTLPLAPAVVQPADIMVHDNNTVAIQFDAPKDPGDPEKPIKEFVVHYTEDDPASEDAQWKEMFWTEPDDDFSVNIPIGGEHFKPDTKYSIKVTARGEIDSPPSEPIVFQTGDGIIPPEKPEINADVPDNVIHVPPGSDYTVGCSSSGFPPPKVFWIDEDGQPLSDGRMLRLQDVKETIKAKCVAENDGGRAETPFEIFVTGPGNAPSNIRLNSIKPRTINIYWDPPTIPNGNITRYIIYYTPLDDQNIIYQMGQIPKKPITEWMTSHKESEPLIGAPQKVDLTDFIEPDTAYAVVLQAVNQDGPGPYSEQHTIRTMSRAREGPPLDLRVEPESQRSANVEWHKPITSEQLPIGYELYYIKADAKIWEDDLASIDDWSVISITEKDEDKLYYKIDGLLEPDTEYVFRIRAVYPDGPGVFSDACITKTLPDGNAPYILISNGDHGVEGETEIKILPGSALDLSCNATGQPRPSVKWIRSGYYPIDPAWVKADEKYAIWFLKVSNITEDTSFNCVAQSPLGFANWTISVRLVPDLQPTWKNDFLIAKNEDGEAVIHFTDDLPDYLKGPHNPWNIYWTDNPSKPFETWNLIPSDGRPLDHVAIPEMESGAKYHLVIEQPSAGIKTPVFDIMTPKPASDIRVGTDINGETVLDFKPALVTEPIKKYIIKYWPDNNPSAVMYMETPANVTDKIVLDGLQPDTEYNFMVIAKFDDGNNLASEPSKIHTPSGDIQCHCAHACMFEEDEEGVITASCYCHNGFKLADDKKSCEPIEDEEAGIVQVTPPTFIPESEHPKELSTMPTGILPQVVGFDGEPLPTNEYGQAVDNLGNPIVWDNEGRPIGPNGIPLRRNYKGEYIYPVIGKDGQLLPTDINMRPIYPLIGPDNQPFQKNQQGLYVDQRGQIFATDTAGRPVSVDGSPYPTDEQGRYIILDSETVVQQAVPTDELGRIIYPIFNPEGLLLTTMEDGRFANEYGELIPTNDVGLPVDEKGEVLPKDSDGNFIYVGNYVLPTDSDGQPVKVQYDGRLLKSDKMGHIIGPDGQLVLVNNEGHPVDESNIVLPTTSDGIFILPMTEGRKGVKRPLNIIGPDGYLLPTMEDGTVLDLLGKTIPTNNIGEPVNYRNEPLPTNSEGQAIYPKDGLDCPLPPTDQHGRPVYSVVGPDGRLLPRKHDGTVVDPDGNLLPTNAAGVPVDRKGRPLPSDRNGSIIYPARGIDTEPLPTDSNGKPIYPVIGLDGNLLPTNQDGRVVDENGRPLPTNAAGVPVNERGEPLPFDENGLVRYPAVTEGPRRPEYIIIGTDGEPLSRNEDGLIIGPDNRPVPTDASGYPVDHRGRPFPRDRNGNIIYPANDLDIEPMPTDRNGRPVYLVIGPDGQLLPKDSNGAVTDINGRPIPTNAAGIPLDHHGKPLPIDRNGYVFYSKESYPSERTDAPFYTILGPDGSPLQRNTDGAIVNPYGRLIPTDSHGYPIDSHGRPLPRDHLGNFIYPVEEMDIEPTPTDKSGRPVYSIIGPNGEVLPRGRSGDMLDPYGRPIPTNAAGVPVNNRGEPLPTDRSGNIIYPAGGLDVPLPPTDSYGRPIYDVIGPDVNNRGEPLPTDRSGNVIYPAGGLDVPLPPTDSYGRPIYDVIGPDGEPLPRGPDGIILDKQGKPIPTNAAGIPVDRYGQRLQQTDTGGFVYPLEEVDGHFLPAEVGKQVYPIIGPDGKFLHQDGDGNVVDPSGHPIPTNEYGIPVDSRGRPLPRDKAGVFIFPAGGLNVEPMPTDKVGRPIYSVMGHDMVPLPTNEDGRPIDKNGKPIPTNAAGVPVDNDGKPLAIDAERNLHYLADGIPATGGRIVIGPDGAPLPTSSDGSIFGPDGKLLLTDENGWPLDKDGKPMPTDIYNNIIYPVQLPDGSVLPTDSHGRPIYPVIGPNGELLPTTEGGFVIGLDGIPVPTNAAGKPVGPDASMLPTDEMGRVIYLPPEKPLSTFATNEYGHIVYPIVDTYGKLLDKDDSGAHITKNGIPVELNENHLPIDPDGNVLPTDSKGNYIFPDVDIMGRILPTDKIGRALYPVIGPDGHLLATDSSGAVIGPDGEPLPTNRLGKPIGPNGKQLPTDDERRFIYIGTKKVVDEEGRPLPTDELGRYLLAPNHPLQPDNAGRLIGPDGQPLSTDDSGNYVYRGKIKYPSEVEDDFGRPLPTNEDGFYVGKDGLIITTESTGMTMDGQSVVLPTDERGTFTIAKVPTVRKSYQILDEKNQILPTDETGNFLNPEGYPIAENEEGKPVSADGIVLPTTAIGHYIFDTTQHKSTLLTEKEKLKIDMKGKLLPTNQSDIVIGPDFYPLPTDEDGQLISEETREKVQFPEPDDGVLPTDEYGRYIKPDGGPYPTDREHRPIYPVIGYDGELLATNDEGLALDPKGHPIPTNSVGRPLDENGVILPMDSQGNVVYGRKNCNTHMGVMDIAVVINVDALNHDNFEHIKKVIQNLVDEYFDLAPDVTQFALVKYSGTAEVPITLGGYNEKTELLEELSQVRIDIKEHPRLIIGINAAKQQFVSFGRENAGKLMIVITDGRDIYPEDRFKDNIIPMLVIGSREFEEEIRDWTKSYILVDSWEELHANSIAKTIEKECLLGRIFIPINKVSPRPKSERFQKFVSLPLPTDELSNIVVVPTREQIFLATDKYGHVIYPAKDSSGRLLPVNENGLAMNKLGRIIKFDDYGKPISPERRPLPTDESGATLHQDLDTNGVHLSTDDKKEWNAVDIDGKPLPTNRNDVSIDMNKEPIAANLAGRHSDSQESLPYSLKRDDNIIMAKRTEKTTDATDSVQPFLYPVIDPDNILSPMDVSDIYVNSVGRAIGRDDSEKPLGPDEEPLPTNGAGGFVYPKNSHSVDQGDKPIGAKVELDQIPKEQKVTAVDLFGRLLPTNKYGNMAIYADVSAVPTDTSKQLVDRDGSLMPIDHHGRYVSDYMPDGTALQESKLLAEVSACDKVEESVNIIFIVESSNATGANLNKIKLSLLDFIKKNINWSIAKVGMISYGSTVDINLDIGNYQSYNDLKESILSLPFIGGAASSDEHAFRTALQLFREKYDNENEELIVHIFTTPLSKDAQIVANYLKMNKTISILSLESSQWHRLENDKEIKKLRSDMCLMLMKSHLAQIRKPNGELKDNMKVDLLRDENGHLMHSFVDQNGQLHVIDSSGTPTDSFDNDGISIGADSRYLSKDDQDRYLYPALRIQDIPSPTDANNRPIYPVRGSDGQLLPTDRIGRVTDNSGQLIPINESGKLLGVNGSAFPTDTNGWFLLAEKEIARVLSENIVGNDHAVYPIIGLNGNPLPNDSSGTNHGGYDNPGIFDNSEKPLLTDENGAFVDPSGKVIPTDKYGRVIGTNGIALATNSSGEFLLGVTKKILSENHINSLEVDESLLPTDESGTLVPTDDQGFHIYPKHESDRMLLSADSEMKLPAKAMEGRSLSTDVVSDDENGRATYSFLNSYGELLSTDSTGRSVERLYLDSRLIPTDRFGRPLHANGLPLSVDGQEVMGVLPINGKVDSGNRHIYPTSALKNKYRPTDSRKLTYQIFGENGKILPADETGAYINADGEPVPTNSYGEPLNSERSSVLATDTSGRYHISKKKLTEDDHRNDMWNMKTRTRYHSLTSSGIGTWTTPSSYCVVSSNVDMILILDSSSSIRVIDHRIMKDFIKNFLVNYFNLQRNYVRVGVVKYGDKVEIPISLGDYNSKTELLSRISETRRMRGEANLGQALLDTAGEFLIFGSKDIPRIVIIFSNGRFRGDLKENARLLRDDAKAHIFLVDVGNEGDNAQNLAIVGESNPHRIIAIDKWNDVNSTILHPFVDELCKLLPQKQDKTSRDGTWPTRQTEIRAATPARICNRVDFQADIIFVLDSSDKVTSEEYANLKEDISMLIDETFNLSHDNVRVGLIEYSDKASVPVPLGYYDHKIQLLADISNSEKLGGVPIILRGLRAAREQFQQHGRNGVSRILILVTSGANRGNVAFAADDLREYLNVSIFVLVVNVTQRAQTMLNRLVGDEYTQQRIISIPSVTKLHELELLQIGQALCGSIDIAAATIRETPHRTTKRDVKYAETKRKTLSIRKDKISHPPMRHWKTTTEHFAPIPLCKDGFLRPYQLSIVVDSTARSPEKDFRLVLNHVANFLKMRFLPESKLMQLNLVSVDSDVICSLLLAVYIKFCRNDEISPKLGRGIKEAILLAKEHAVKGVIQIILIISADGTSSDDAIQSAEYARNQYGHGVVAISVRAPFSELLKELSLGSSTKVIHFPDWSIGNELFQSWIAHAFCSYVSVPVTRKAKLPRMTRPPIRKTKISMNDATNVEVTPLSPNSLLVSWTCCTNNKADYIISYTPDLSLPIEYWQKLNATCRDSFGRKIDGLPSDNTYTVCVETLQRFANKSAPLNLNECETVQLNSDTTASPNQKISINQSISQCQCICANNGEALVKPACGTVIDPFRPVATLPPAADNECPCSMPSKGGLCPSGYFLNRGQCYDVNECQQQNGGCSHACVNTPGDFYCACPHGMMRDPVDPKLCINVASSFDRIAALLGQYLHANRFNASVASTEKSDAQIDGKIVKYKATVKSEDDKTISFEWSLMPAIVRRAFKWLF